MVSIAGLLSGASPVVSVAGFEGRVILAAQGITETTLTHPVTSPVSWPLRSGDRIEVAEGARVRIVHLSSSALTGARGFNTEVNAELHFDGPAVVQRLGPAEYRWFGKRVTVRSVTQRLSLEATEGHLTIDGGSLRLRRTPDGLGVFVLIAKHRGGADAVTLRVGDYARPLKAGKALLISPAGRIREIEPPGVPRPLYPKLGAQLQAFRFTWQGVIGAERYRIEIARDPNFLNLVHVAEETETTHARMNHTVPVGTLFWRVTAIMGGHEGAPSEAFSVQVDPWDSPW